MLVKRRENETVSSLLYRFSKKVQQSGVLKEAKKRRFRARPQNKTKRKASALYRSLKRTERERLKKLGLV